MKIALLSLAFLALAMTGCAPLTGKRPASAASNAGALPTPHGITRKSGAAQARRDIAAGKLRLLEAGTRGVYTPGVPFGDPRYDSIPRHTLPVGCTTPGANQWVQYAEGYNAMVLRSVLE